MKATPASAAVPAAASGAAVPAFLATTAGRLAMIAAHTILLAITGAAAWPAVGVALVLLCLLPAHRRTLLALATIGVVAFAPPVDPGVLAAVAASRGAEPHALLWPLAAVLVLAFGCAFVEAVYRLPGTVLARRPVLVLLVLLASLLVVAGDLEIGGAPWLLAVALSMGLSSYIWFFAYAASEVRLPGAPPAVRQLGYWRPFWGFSNVPIGKGAAYLERVEARDADALSAVQWKGLRLMAWCTVLFVFMDAFRFAAYAPGGLVQSGPLAAWFPGGVPPIAGLLEAEARGAPFPFATRWAAVFAEFVMTVLHMTTWGNSIVATCRMAGYDIALNTDRPLLSTSVSEFYNRFYFYFKELLATFFFYPTYLTYFRSNPRVRLFVATLVAAGFGNFLFHFLRDSAEVYRLGLSGALWAYRSYAVYALLLGFGIAVSQVRLLARGRRPPTGLRRVAAIAVVLWFYGLLGVLDVRSPFDLSVYAAVYASLFVP